jgi:hypothetical protein
VSILEDSEDDIPRSNDIILKLFKMKIDTLFLSQSVVILILNTRRPTVFGYGMIKNGMRILGRRGLQHNKCVSERDYKR